MSSQLQHKFQQFEATPPKDAWLAIEERLNNSDPALQEKLYNYEATPPAKVWNEIKSSLDNATNSSSTIPFTSRKWLRYAVAAAILGIVALGVFTYTIKKPESTIAQNPTINKEKVTPNAITTTPTTSSRTNDAPKAIIPIKEESISVPTSSSSKNQDVTITKRYKIVAKEDGKLVRLSQKAYAVFDCAVKGAAQRSETCKENIQTMQAKMASSMVSPTTDFAGLIDMIKTLEENK
jgi:hypothetical protein